MRKKRIYRKKAKIRNHRVKKKMDFFKKKSFWISIFFFLLFSALIYFLFFSKYFQVNEIKIFGNQKVSSEELANLIFPKINKKIIFSTKAVFLIDVKGIEKAILAKFSQIEKVKITRKLPDILTIEVLERKTFAIFCQDLEDKNECFRIDQNGVAFERTQDADGLVVYFQKESIGLGEKIIEPDKLESISTIAKKLDEELKIEIEKILSLDKRLNVKTKQGFEIYFDLENDILEQIFNLDALLKEKIPPENRGNLKYIDLRFGNRVYYK